MNATENDPKVDSKTLIEFMRNEIARELSRLEELQALLARFLPPVLRPRPARRPSGGLTKKTSGTLLP